MTQTDPTAQGLPINHDQQPKYRDIFDFAYQKWIEENDALEVDDGTPRPAIAMNPHDSDAAQAVQGFIAKARRLFSANQPVGQDFMPASLALRFQDGSILQFVDVSADGMGGNAGSQDVSKNHQVRGKGTTAPSPSWGVTGH